MNTQMNNPLAGGVLVDPPFNFSTRSEKGQERAPSQHYGCMTLDEIVAYPVAAKTAADAFLFLWVPPPHTLYAEPIMKAWGFTFSGLAFVWIKTTKNANVTPLSVTAAPGAKSPWHTGMGFGTRANAELCWLGRRGKPQRLSKGVHQLIVAPVREHSRKPDAMYERIEEFCAGPYLELFARQRRPGWISLGDEVDRFTALEQAS
jgi:N6-adenosine-specific RNA methylase IME4